MRKYLKHLKADIPASVFVFLVALPLCLGIALGSGAPLFSGLVAGIVGGIVIGIISKSHLSVSGPAAGLTTIVAVAISTLPAFEAFLLSVVIAGGIQVIFGIIKAGKLGDFIPSAVIKGMLAAIGLILILKQIPHLVGYDKDFEGNESFFQADGQNTFTEIVDSIYHITPGAVLIGIFSLLVMIAWETPIIKGRSWVKWVPAPLIAVIGGTLLNELYCSLQSPLSLDTAHLVAIPVAASASEFADLLKFPDFTFLRLPEVWFTGLTLALVASLESLLGIEAVDRLDPHKRVTPPNRELVAQGIGNIASGMLGGLPVTSVVVRSSANVTAGAESKISTILHGLLLFLSVAFIPMVLNQIPLSALAGVLIFVGYKLTKPSIAKDLLSKGTDQFIPFLVTVAAILFSDLLIGISIGILCGVYFILRSNFKHAILFVADGNNYLLRFKKEVSFLNKSYIREVLMNIPDGSSLLIDSSKCNFIDHDIKEAVQDFVASSATRNIRVEYRMPPGMTPSDLGSI